MAKASFNWQDPFLLDSQLSDDERAIKDAAAAYCQDKLLPRVTQAFRDGTTDPAIFREMGEMGLLGVTVPEEYGGESPFVPVSAKTGAGIDALLEQLPVIVTAITGGTYNRTLVKQSLRARMRVLRRGR